MGFIESYRFVAERIAWMKSVRGAFVMPVLLRLGVVWRYATT